MSGAGDSPTITPDQIVAPNLFDAYVDPTIMASLVLANLMSDRLWELSSRVPAAGDDMLSQARAARRVVDRYFMHITPVQVAATYGTLSLADEAARIGGDYVADAAAKIIDNLTYRVTHGLISPEVSGLELMHEGRFPAYGYANLDMLHAERKILGRMSGRPQGMTSCLDEVALFSALLLTRSTYPISGIAWLSSPVHYTAFGFSPEAAWWFYGKRRLYEQDEFRQMARAEFGGDAAAAWSHVMGGLDRITTRRGTFDLVAGTSAVPRADLNRLVMAMDHYFGGRLPALAAALARSVRPVPSSSYDALFRQCLHLSSAAEVRHVITKAGKAPGPLREPAQNVLMSYRSLEVENPGVYLVASLRSPMIRKLAAGVTSVAEAMDLVMKVAGDQPVLRDRNRVALAAETWRLGTGSDREKALLLHALLSVRFQDVTTLFTAEESYVSVGDTCIRAGDGLVVPLPVPDEVVCQMQLPTPQPRT